MFVFEPQAEIKEIISANYRPAQMIEEGAIFLSIQTLKDMLVKVLPPHFVTDVDIYASMKHLGYSIEQDSDNVFGFLAKKNELSTTSI